MDKIGAVPGIHQLRDVGGVKTLSMLINPPEVIVLIVDFQVRECSRVC